MPNDNNAFEQDRQVSIKIPPFIASNPAVWFQLVDMCFELGKVTCETTKFKLLITSLDTKYIAEVQDLILKPPELTPYSTLKKELINRLSSSEEEKTRRLLEHEEIGDRRPSQFLRHLQQLAGSSFPDNILRTLWIGRLPQNVQAILASQKTSDLSEVADLADRVMEALTPKPSIVVATTSTPNPDNTANVTQMLEALTTQVAMLNITVAELQRRDRSPARSQQYQRFRSRSRQRSNSKQRINGQNNVCWYHHKFGDNAKRCTQPCTYSTGNATGSR